MKTWNFGIVGAGMIGDFHSRAIKDLANAKLYGVCDIDAERAKNLAKKYDCRAFNSYAEMFAEKEIDIVTIGTPSALHLAPAIAAAKAGKNVLCEKPMEITVERIDAMIAAHKESGTSLGCIFQTRFTPAIEPLREAITQGRFGTITYAGVYVPWWRTDEYYQNSWHGTWKLDGGGALMNQSIHRIDTLCDLMPPVETVQAFTSKTGHPHMETEDTATAVLRFTNGVLGIIYGTTASYPGQFMRLEISGTKGTAIYVEEGYTVFEFKDAKPEDKEVMEKYGEIKQVGGVSDPTDVPHGLHTLCFKDFIETLETGKKFRVDGAEARKSVELICAIYKSAQELKPVVINSVSQQVE